LPRQVEQREKAYLMLDDPLPAGLIAINSTHRDATP
jgi:hypothetical protein